MFRINWEITSKCNYSCRYCYNQGTKKEIQLDELKINRVLDNILDLDYDKYSFTLTGGEPTLSPYLKFIIDSVFDKFGGKLSYLNFITNGSQDEDYFHQFTEYPFDKFFIRFSIHPKYWNQQKRDTLCFLIKNKVKLMISVLFDISFRENVIEIIEWINQFQLDYFFQPSLRKIFGCDSVKYTEPDLNYLFLINKLWRAQEEITNTSRNVFTGKFCSFGKNLLVINSDLSFASGYCPECETIKIPFIYLTPEKIKDRITHFKRCRMSCCEIPTNLLIPKFNTKEEAIQFLDE